MELKLLCFYYEKKIKIKREGGGSIQLCIFCLIFGNLLTQETSFFFFLKKQETSFLAVYDCLLKKRKRKRNKFLKTHFF